MLRSHIDSYILQRVEIRSKRDTKMSQPRDGPRGSDEQGMGRESIVRLGEGDGRENTRRKQEGLDGRKEEPDEREI